MYDLRMTTREDIGRWLDVLYGDPNLTHMIVKCDWFDYSDYPVYVSRHEDVRKREEGQDRVMEVYSASYDRASQLAERRAFHYD